MIKDTQTHPYKDRKYEIVAYDPNWPKRFETYASKIRQIFGDIQIEHIGSTSVPGMSGKSCVDVLVILPNTVALAKEHQTEMEQAGFEYAGSFVTEDSVLFRIIENNTLIANIHFFPSGHPHNTEMLNLRDYLRDHPEEVLAYSTCKKDLESRYADDYASYRKFKDEYMEKLKERVKNEFA